MRNRSKIEFLGIASHHQSSSQYSRGGIYYLCEYRALPLPSIILMAPPLQQLRTPDFFSITNSPSILNPHEYVQNRKDGFSAVVPSPSQRNQQMFHILRPERTYATFEKFRICCGYSLLVFSKDEIAKKKDVKQGPLSSTLVGSTQGDVPSIFAK